MTVLIVFCVAAESYTIQCYVYYKHMQTILPTCFSDIQSARVFFSKDIKIFHAYLHFLTEYLLSWHTFDVWRPVVLKCETQIIETNETHEKKIKHKKSTKTKYFYRNIGHNWFNWIWSREINMFGNILMNGIILYFEFNFSMQMWFVCFFFCIISIAHRVQLLENLFQNRSFWVDHFNCSNFKMISIKITSINAIHSCAYFSSLEAHDIPPIDRLTLAHDFVI